MAQKTAPRIAIKYGWDLGETEWKTGMDENLVKLDSLYGLSVISRVLTTPPITPAEGDAYIVATTATDEWLGEENSIAVFVNAAWVFYTPNQGWPCRVENEDDCLIFFNGTTWDEDVYMVDGGDLIFGTSLGTKVATADTQLMGFWGKTPIVQPTGAGQSALTNSSGGVGDGTIDAISGSGADVGINKNFTEVYTLLDAIRTALVNSGLIKGSA